MALAVGVLAWLGFSLAALPAYERAGSLRPAKRLIAVLALGALATLVVSDVVSSELRSAVVVLSVTAFLIVASALVHRTALRRVPTLLVGPADAVNRLAARWEDRHDLVVVGRCTWDSTQPLGSATVNSVVRDVPKLLRTAHGARVVITADQALGDPSLRHLAWGLQRAEIECLVLTDMNEYVEFVRPTRVGDQLALALDPPNSHLVGQAIKAFCDRTFAALAILLRRAADGPDRAGDPPGLARADHLPPGAHGQGRRAVHDLQVPHDGGRRRAARRGAARPQRGRRPAVQDDAGPPGHPGRPDPAPDVARRAAAAVQRAAGRHGPGRTAPGRSRARRRSTASGCGAGCTSSPA